MFGPVIARCAKLTSAICAHHDAAMRCINEQVGNGDETIGYAVSPGYTQHPQGVRMQVCPRPL